MLIGKLALESGFSRDTIRYYERMGLLQDSASCKLQNGYTDYQPGVLEQLIHIKQLKELGFTLNEIKSLLETVSTEPQPCGDLPQKLDKKIAQLDEKMLLITLYRDKLLAVRKACNGECASEAGLPECFGSQCC
jgi:DNA-binding transcriptional MerR regulator